MSAGDPIVTLTSGQTSASKTDLPYNLKLQYEDGFRLQFANHNIIYGTCVKNGNIIKYGGGAYTFYVMSEEGGNYVAVAETGYARAPKKRDGVLGSQTIPGYNLQTVAASIPEEFTEKKQGAVFYKAVADESEKGTAALERHIGRQLYGDGLCTLCKTASVTTNTSTLVTVDTTYGAKTTRWLRKYDDLMWFINTTADELDATSVPVAEITSSTTFKTTGNFTGVNTSGTEYVTFHDNREYSGGSPVYHELDGLGKICSTTTTLMGIAPGTSGNEAWKAVVNASDTTFDAASFFDVWAGTQFNGGKGKYLVFCSPEEIRPWNEVMSGLVRTTPDKQGVVNFEPISAKFANVNGTGVTEIKPVLDWMCPPGEFYGFPEGDLALLVEIDMQFLDKDVMVRIPRTLYKEGQLCWAGNTLVRNRNHFFRYGGLTDYTLISGCRG